jgi:hypothetical protein
LILNFRFSDIKIIFIYFALKPVKSSVGFKQVSKKKTIYIMAVLNITYLKLQVRLTKIYLTLS